MTVIDDLGDSFTHISGNTGDAIAVGIGEAKRLKEPPKRKTSSLGWELYKANRTSTDEKRKESTDYIAKFDFGGKYLVYSITRYGSLLAALEAPKPES